jgi:hypothetical protein
MAREYASEVPVGREYAAAPKAATFTPDEDTQYTEAGIPLVAPSAQAEPSGAAGTAAKVMTDVVGAPVRAAMSLAKPVTNVMGWMGMEEPGKAVKQMDTGIKEQGPEFMGIKSPIGSAASLAGDIYGYGKILSGLGKLGAPLSQIPGAAPVVNAISKSPALQSTLGGGAVGVLGTESPTEMIKEGAIGAGLGALTHGVLTGAGKALDPALTRVKDLMSKGFTKEEIMRDTSIGQMLGGNIQKIENFLSTLPFSRAEEAVNKGAKSLTGVAKEKAELGAQATKQAITGLTDTKNESLKALKTNLETKHAGFDKQHDAFFKQRADKLAAEEEQFSINQINKALNLIGEKLEPGVKGTKAITEAQQKLSNAYNKPLSEMDDIRFSPEAETEFKTLAESHKDDLIGTKYADMLDNEIEKLVTKAGDSRLLTPDQWHTQLKALGDKAYKYGKSFDPEQQQFGQALKDIRSAWADLADNEGIRAANKAYSLFQPAQKASSYIKSVADQGGVFDPKQYLNAIKSETSTKRFAGATHPEQAEAVAAYEQMMAKRAAEKQLEADMRASTAAKKKAEKTAISDSAATQTKNIKKQAEYLEAQNKAKNKLAKEGVEAATAGEGGQSYGERRLAYQLSGLGGAGGLGYLGHMAGIPAEALAALGGGTIAASRYGLYNPAIQELIKKTAMAPRSETARQAGQALKEIAPGAALSNVQQFKEYRRPGVQVFNPDTMEELTPPK